MTENENSTPQTPHSDPSQTEIPQTEVPQTEIPQDVPLPAPALIGLISGLASQTMISLGIFPNPINGSTHILLHQGKHLIETIALLDEKTKGNQTAEETKMFAEILHELRMIFVAAQNEKQKRDNE